MEEGNLPLNLDSEVSENKKQQKNLQFKNLDFKNYLYEQAIRLTKNKTGTNLIINPHEERMYPMEQYDLLDPFSEVNEMKKTISFTLDAVIVNLEKKSTSILGKTESSLSKNLEKINIKMSKLKFGHIAHELVYWALTGEEPKMWRQDPSIQKLITTEEVVPKTKLTPDLIYNMDPLYIVFELGTTEGNPLRTFTDKLNKYKAPLSLRSKNKFIVYFALVIGTNSYCTNIPGFSEVFDSKSLMLHQILGLQLKNLAKSQGWIDVSEEKNYKDEIQFGEEMSKFKLEDFPNKDPPYISADLINHWRSNPISLKENYEKYTKIFHDLAIDGVRKHLKDRSTKSLLDETDEKINYFSHKFKKGERRIDKKGPMNLSLLLNTQNSTMNLNEDRIHVDKYDPIHVIWSKALHKYPDVIKEDRDLNETLEILKKDLSIKSQNKLLRRQKNRLVLDVKKDKEVMDYLFEYGIYYDETSMVQQAKHELMKLPFHWDTDLSDIDQFIDITGTMLLEENDCAPVTNNLVEELKDKARSCWSDKNQLAKDLVKSFRKTKLFCAMDVVSEIMEEINISISQRCNKKKIEMIIKKLKHHNVFLLMRTTEPQKNFYFSLAFLKRDFEPLGKPFREVIDAGDFWITDFCTFNSAKVDNMLNCSELTMSMFYAWADIYEIDLNMSLLEKDKNICMLKTFLCNFLIYYEAKKQTSKNSLDFRYEYNNITSIQTWFFEPLKLSDKFDTRPKSRLLLWFYKRLIKALRMMVIQPVVQKNLKSTMTEKDKELNAYVSEEMQTEVSSDNFDNLINYCSLLPVRRFEIMNNVMYIGSWFNKKEEERTTDSMKTSQKAASQEILMKFQNPRKMGYDTVKDYKELKALKDHEFDQQYVRFAAQNANLYLSRKYGKDYKEIIRSKIIKKFKKETYEKLATTKASAVWSSYKNYEEVLNEAEKMKHKRKVFENLQKKIKNKKKEREGKEVDVEEYVEKISGTEDYKAISKLLGVNEDVEVPDIKVINKRVKCIEAVCDYIKANLISSDSNKPLLNLKKIYDDCVRQGGVMVNLFKKAQLGGVREIYVLTILSRILVLFLEVINRFYSKEMPFDAQAKPELKIVRGEDFFNDVSRLKKELNLNREFSAYSTRDQSTWAQKFPNSVFSCMMHELLTEDLYLTSAHIHNLFTDKKIELPQVVLNNFIKKKNVQTYEDDESGRNVINELKDQFFGKSKDNDLLDNNSFYMKNLSNMMQGIQHFTSNMLHVIHAFTFVKIANGYFEKYFGERSKLFKLKMYAEISSDDSSFTMVMLWNDESMNEIEKEQCFDEVSTFFHLISKALDDSYPLICSQTSKAKTTSCHLNNIKEFNSIWTIRNTQLSPLIKFVYSGMKVEQATRMEERQLLPANSRKQIVENGGSFLLCSVIQELHANIHYKALGSNTSSEMFEIFGKLLISKPHPSYGFFIYEPMKLCGTMSYDYAYWNALRNLPDMSKIERRIYEKGEMEMDELGKPSVTVNLLLGGNIKWLQAIKRQKIPENWKDVEDPRVDYEFLFTGSENCGQSLKLNYKKLLTPSLSASYSFRTHAKLHAASVYILQTQCILVKERDMRQVILDKTLEELKKIREEEMTKAKLEKERKLMNKEFTMSRKSLIQALTEQEVSDNVLSENMFTFLFPNQEYYIDASVMINKYQNSSIIGKSVRRPSKMCTLFMSRSSRLCSLDLLTVCQQAWFNKSDRGTREEHAHCFSVYKSVFPWISSTVEESVLRSPFNDVFSLSEFIRSVSTRTTTFRVLGQLQRGLPFPMQIEKLIKNHFMKNKILYVFGETNFVPTGRQLVKTINNELIILNSAPIPSMSEKLFKTLEILRKHKGILREKPTEMMYDLLNLKNDQEKTLAVLQAFAKNLSYEQIGTYKDDKGSMIKKVEVKTMPLSIDLTNLLLQTNQGRWLFFNKEQEYNEDKKRYLGEGQITGYCHGLVFRASVIDENLQILYCNSLELLQKNQTKLKKMLNEVGIIGNLEQDSFTKIKYDLRKGISTIDEKSVPVILVENLIAPPINDDKEYLKTFFLTFDGKVELRIKSIKEQRNRSSKILSYKPNKFSFKMEETEFDILKLADDKNLFFKPWIKNERLEVRSFQKVIYELVSELEDDPVIRFQCQEDFSKTYSSYVKYLTEDEKINLKDWMYKTLMMRCERRGIKPNSILSSVTKEKNVALMENLDKMEMEFEKLNFNKNVDFDKIDEKIRNKEIVPEVMGSEETYVFPEDWVIRLSFVKDHNTTKFYDELSSVPEEGLTIIDKKIMDYAHMTKFWDDVIDNFYLVEKDHLNCTELLVGKNEVTYSDQKPNSPSFGLSWLVGNHKRSAKITREDQVNDFAFVEEEDDYSDDDY